MASAISETKIFPSPMAPVRAASMIVRITSSLRADRDHHLELDLGQQVHVVLAAAVHLFMALLPAVAAHLADGDPVDADGS